MKPSWPLLIFVHVMMCHSAFAQTDSWKEQFDRELPALGHRNWVVIADSAYPAQTSPGVKVILTDSPHLKVVQEALRAIQNAKHVRPVIYLDNELPYVEERFAPGVGEFRKALEDQLKPYQVTPVPHEQLLKKLSEAGESYRILVLKSELTLPYTSVFVELDAGYWSSEAEASLRRKMRE
jgi:L-fucose mutarotase/ribose pyranase (RbsD/FucU family)